MKYVFEITIDKVWIDDGFSLNAEYLKEAILETLLGYARDHEVEVKQIE